MVRAQRGSDGNRRLGRTGAAGVCSSSAAPTTTTMSPPTTVATTTTTTAAPTTTTTTKPLGANKSSTGSKVLRASRSRQRCHGQVADQYHEHVATSADGRPADDLQQRGLQRIGLTGQAATDVRALVTADTTVLTDIATSDGTDVTRDLGAMQAADNALRADLGLPAASG